MTNVPYDELHADDKSECRSIARAAVNAVFTHPQAVEPKAPYTLTVPTGGGAVMFIVNPASDPHIGWMLRYAGDLNQPQAGRFSAASIIDSFDYLLSGHIAMTEATRRLRALRAARRSALAANQGAA
jgi:hypothetical protein